MSAFNRRNFLKVSGIAVLPAFLPQAAIATGKKEEYADEPIIKFFYDGEDFNPAQYIAELQKINSKEAIKRDFYLEGGAVAAMEKKFEEITGKEKAACLPTGTMANQLAIAVLSGNNTKVFVQDNSHVYRDEADAAQSVHKKRLMPLAMGKTYFTAEELKNAIAGLKEQEVFSSGIGAVSIENPVRRTEGRMVPIEEIRKISEYCRSNNIPLHLDGARIYMAAAWSGVSVKEYASYFDTVYISLYKYLGGANGAVLCGSKSVMDKIPHLIKIHGGTVFSNWFTAAMVLSRLEGIENRLKQAIKQSEEIFSGLNKIPGLQVSALDGGTNIYALEMGKTIDGNKLQQRLNKEFNIRIIPPGNKSRITLTVNETILYKDAAYIISAFKSCAG
ncbi:MAG TPA: aminotransferase class I/II-fold pyridoxal phosphate-dependent enzyme [Chitinophagaceae bacterium]|nr:aminotransferase class I/II-fold pyridoxal phosphate-dependent enzyme [Chitinophagaceae bacterium]HNU13777.1 aminotransferase class I/II-fold pyridoxal phosphate-dependent enzyme [Chitinophagaceae bacterium]